MVSTPGPTEAAVDNILNILNPLLTAPTDATVRSISQKFHANPPPQDALAATINVFAKLMAFAPTKTPDHAEHAADPDARQDAVRRREVELGDRLEAIRLLVSHLRSSKLISSQILYEAIDSDTHQIIEPNVKCGFEERRLRTRMWFTQARYNLFREESEGYAKVISLLWDCMTTTREPSAVLDSLLALIGRFSLDSNRVTELVLSGAADVIQGELTKSYAVPKDHHLPRVFAHVLDQFARDHVHAVIGAMLRTYQPQPGGDGDSAPEVQQTEIDSKAVQALLALIAVMVREGRMNIGDVWHQLSPRDNSVFAERFVRHETALKELVGTVSSSRVPTAKPGDDPAKFPRPGSGSSDRDVFGQYKLVAAGPLTQFSSQKIDLIGALIGMCRWNDAMAAILSLAVADEHVDIAAHPQVSGPLVGFTEVLLNPLLHSKFPEFYASNARLTDAIRELGGSEQGYPVPVTTIEQFLSDDPNGSGAAVRQMLHVLGPNARVSSRLLHALCRLLKGRHEEQAVNIMREVVLPSASLIQTNASLANLIWDVLKEWSHTTRWDLYGYLHNEVSSLSAAYSVVASRASYEMRYILKRLTTDNQRQYMSAIAKISHGQALPAFAAVLDRVQGYPADSVTISPVVESCRRCTDLSLDMLLYLLIDRMADSARSRLKEDGINTAQWYATLSLFLGMCLRKLHVVPQHVEGVLGFLYTKLVEDKEALIIIALSDVIKCVADIEVDINLSARQIAAHGGGPHLLEVVSGVWSKLQADPQLCGTAFDFRNERERNGATSALLAAFERTGIHSYLAVAIGQMTRDAIYQESIKSMPLKLGANIVDMARTSLLQMSRFMDTTVSDATSEKDLRNRIWKPLASLGMADMIKAMRVPTSSAVALMNPILNYGDESFSTKTFVEQGQNGKPNEMTSDVKVSSLNGRTRTLSNGKDSDESGKATSSSAGVDQPENSASALGSEQGRTKVRDGVTICETDSGSNEETTTDDFSSVIFAKTGACLSQQLIRAFWVLKLSDIAVPTTVYEEEQKRVAAIKSVWEKEVEVSRRHVHGDMDRLRRLELELRRIREYVEKLELERKAVSTRQAAVLGMLRDRKGALHQPEASQDKAGKHRATCYFLQECVLQRCKVSRPDALFCSKFVQLLLELDIPAINFANFFKQLLELIPTVLRSCSENESLCLSFFVKEELSTLERWRSNRKVFEVEAAIGKKNGFLDEKSGSKQPLKHEQFCQWLFDIHQSLCDGFCAVLSSDEYLYLRNSLSILNGVVDVFPKVSEHSAKLETCVQKLTTSELADIQLTATGVLARLRAGKAKRLPQHIFKLRPVNASSGSQISKLRPKLPEPAGKQIPHREKPHGPPAQSPVSDTKSRPSVQGDSKVAAPSLHPTAKESPKPLPKVEAKQEAVAEPVQQRSKPPVANSAGKPSLGSASMDAPNGNVRRPPAASAAKEAEKPLNPNAVEFVPAMRNVSGGGATTGKRARGAEGESKMANLAPQESRLSGSRQQGEVDKGPPLKKAKSEDTTRPSGRDGKAPSAALPRRPSRNKDLGSRSVPNRDVPGRDGSKRDGPSRSSSGREIGSRDSGRHAAAPKGSPRDAHRNEPEKQSQAGVSGHSGRNRGDDSAMYGDIHKAEGAVKSGPGRGGPRGRSPPGRGSSKPALPPNGRSTGPGSGAHGSGFHGREGGPSGSGSRRDGPGADSGGRSDRREDGMRSGGVRDGSGGRAGDTSQRRRDGGGGYDYSGAGGSDRRSGETGAEFRRSGSEGRFGDGPGGPDYGREYQSEVHGGKRRRDHGGGRGGYGYESGDGRRPVRPRSDGGDYDRGRDEAGGKMGHDRRYNGHSPGRDAAGMANAPGWMEGRRHGEMHDGGRRREDGEDVGWQAREREFEGGGRGPRREERDGDYYDRGREDRYREGQRRDDRRERRAGGGGRRIGGRRRAPR